MSGLTVEALDRSGNVMEPFTRANCVRVRADSAIARVRWEGAQKRHPPKPVVPADQVVLSFLDAKKTGDYKKVKPYLDQASIVMVESAFSSRQARSAGFGRKEAEEMYIFGQTPTKDQMREATIKAVVAHDDDIDEETMALVRVTTTPKTPSLIKLDLTSEQVLINEGGKWKIDALLSGTRGMKGIKLPPGFGK